MNVINYLKQNTFIKLAGLFIISRVIFYYTLDLSFVAHIAQWQLADIELLRHDLFRTIWYLHAQPPLYNFYTALFLKAFSNIHDVLYALCMSYKAITLLAAFLIFRTVLMVTGKPKIAWIIFIIIIFHPTILLYENQYSYTQIEFFIISLVLFIFTRFIKSREDKDIVWLSVALSALCLTRSFFHPYLIILIVLGTILFFAKKKINTFVKSSVPLVVVLGWCYKNYVLYGVFSLTSWLGLNMTKMYPIKEGPLSKVVILSNIENFSGIIEFKKYPKPLSLLNADTTSLGALNLNNINYITVSNLCLKEIKKEYFKKEKLNVIFHKIIDASFIFFNPAGNYYFLYGNNKKIYPYAKVFNFYLYNYDKDYKELWFPNDKKSFLLTIIMMLLLISSSGVYIYKYNRKFLFLFLFALMLLSYITLIGCVLEYGENNRFRYSTHPILFIFLGMTLDLIFTQIRAKKLVNA